LERGHDVRAVAPVEVLELVERVRDGGADGFVGVEQNAADADREEPTPSDEREVMLDGMHREAKRVADGASAEGVRGGGSKMEQYVESFD
jgi:hypothetical protein